MKQLLALTLAVALASPPQVFAQADVLSDLQHVPRGTPVTLTLVATLAPSPAAAGPIQDSGARAAAAAGAGDAARDAWIASMARARDGRRFYQRLMIISAVVAASGLLVALSTPETTAYEDTTGQAILSGAVFELGAGFAILGGITFGVSNSHVHRLEREGQAKGFLPTPPVSFPNPQTGQK